MVNDNQFPKTLQAAIQYFADEMRCITFLANIRWPDQKAACPNCGDKDSTYFMTTQKRWKCRSCKKQFSVKQGTIFEDSPISLSKWFPAIWLICGAKNGISSCEIARALGVTQKTAWFMMHRIRLAMTQGSFEKMSGEVEVDETYIGGLSRFMHKDRRKKGMVGSAGKVAVFGLLERGDKKSRVRTKVVKNATSDVLQGEIRNHVETGSRL